MATAPHDPPFIVTLQLDTRTQAFFDELRERWFPPAINHLKAHLTLFHNLPAVEENAVVDALAGEAARTAPFPLAVAGLMKLGRGVAYRIESDALLAVRARLAEAFRPWLIAQDRQRFRPHVTIQNKVSPQEAAGLHDHLSDGFEPFEAMAEGFQLWRYLGGPWAPSGAVGFARLA